MKTLGGRGPHRSVVRLSTALGTTSCGVREVATLATRIPATRSTAAKPDNPPASDWKGWRGSSSLIRPTPATSSPNPTWATASIPDGSSTSPHKLFGWIPNSIRGTHVLGFERARRSHRSRYRRSGPHVKVSFLRGNRTMHRVFEITRNGSRRPDDTPWYSPVLNDTVFPQLKALTRRFVLPPQSGRRPGDQGAQIGQPGGLPRPRAG